MKKSVVLLISTLFILVFFILLVFSVSLTRAQMTPSGVPPEVDKIANIGEKVPTDTDSAKETAREYLAKEWIIILRNNTYARPMVIIIEWTWQRTSPVINPVSKTILGFEPVDGWKFLIALVVMVFLGYWFSTVLRTYSSFSNSVSTVLGICLAVIFGVLGFYSSVAGWISFLLVTWWAKLILVIIVILVFAFSFYLKQTFMQIREKRKKSQEEETLIKLKAEEKIAKNFTEGINKGLDN